MFWTRIKAFSRRLRNRNVVEQELDDEVRSYLHEAIHEKIAQGLSPQEARRAALLEFGGAEQVKELVRCSLNNGHDFRTTRDDGLEWRHAERRRAEKDHAHPSDLSNRLGRQPAYNRRRNGVGRASGSHQSH